ncbi:MAG: hypothetical protein HKN21_16085 [Candidatus Eisenbacteria bacterium]|uniref:Uncharacterized protein n=1 Tax=Eiseniibacteriota bacterium TaxID=2212470 RepID=A0A7Y2EC97_UNCEI|nr:hypothetical protein [Candidatus Eisenbacteria bacterium]
MKRKHLVSILVAVVFYFVAAGNLFAGSTGVESPASGSNQEQVSNRVLGIPGNWVKAPVLLAKEVTVLEYRVQRAAGRAVFHLGMKAFETAMNFYRDLSKLQENIEKPQKPLSPKEPQRH